MSGLILPRPGRSPKLYMPRLIIDDFSGGLASDAPPDTIQDNQFSIFQNWLINEPGVAQKRGSIPKVAPGTAFGTGTVTQPSYLVSYKGAISAGATYPPYYILDASSSFQSVYADADGAGWVDIFTGQAPGHRPNGGDMTSRPAYVGNRAFIAGVINGGFYAPKNDMGCLYQFAGTAHAQANGINASVTQNSTAVSFATDTLSKSMEGSFFMGDTVLVSQQTYKIVTVTDARNMVIDKVWAGATNAAKSFIIIPCTYYSNNKFPAIVNNVAQPTGLIPAKLAFANWNRICWIGSSNSLLPSDLRYANRMYWSGRFGSNDNDGTATPLYVGGDYTDPNGFVDVDVAGAINAVQVHQNFTMLFADRGIIQVSGSPVTNGQGSLNLDTVYQGYTCNGPRAVCSTPYGMFFYDQVRGPMEWNGAGNPIGIGENKVFKVLRTIAPDEVYYYRDHVYFMSSAGKGCLVYYIPTKAWISYGDASSINGLPASVHLKDVQIGRSGEVSTVAAAGNMFGTTDTANFNGGTVGQWVAGTNTTIAAVSGISGVPNGKALRLTATAAGNLNLTPNAASNMASVVGDVNYTVTCGFLAASVARTCRFDVQWYNAAAGLISTTSGIGFIEGTPGTLTNAFQTFKAPRLAVAAKLVVQILAVGAGEIHYMTSCGMFQGVVSAYTDPNVNIYASLARNESVVGMSLAGGFAGAGGSYVVNVANTIDAPGDLQADYEGSSIACQMRTKVFGGMIQFRVKRVNCRYRCGALSASPGFIGNGPQITLLSGPTGVENSVVAADGVSTMAADHTNLPPRTVVGHAYAGLKADDGISLDVTLLASSLLEINGLEVPVRINKYAQDTT